MTMLRAPHTATRVGRNRDYGPNQQIASHHSEAMRIAGHLCDSLVEEEQRAIPAPAARQDGQVPHGTSTATDRVTFREVRHIVPSESEHQYV